MLLPFLAWAVTGAVFFTKPGYGAAYDALPIRTYPLDGPSPSSPIRPGARSRFVRTILGLHLLVAHRRRAGDRSIRSRCSRRPCRRDGDVQRLHRRRLHRQSVALRAHRHV